MRKEFHSLKVYIQGLILAFACAGVVSLIYKQGMFVPLALVIFTCVYAGARSALSVDRITAIETLNSHMKKR